MLLLTPPYLQSGRLTIFRDDVSKETFYHACSVPKIAVNEFGEPKVYASAILPETGIRETERSAIVEATFAMDTELKPTEEELEEAKLAIKEEWGVKPKAFAPAPIIEGSVYMLVAAAGDEPNPDDFFITPKVAPSILGSNRAALMAKANGLHATNMIASLNEDLFTASVFYELTLVGITPSFKAHMSIDWEKVYKHFEEMEKMDFIFYKKEIQKQNRSLEESNAITITIEELDPDVKSAAARQLFDELSDKIIEKIFNPKPMPKATASNIAEGASRVISALLPGAHHILKEKKEVQMASTVLNISERKAKKMTFYPQALVSSMLEEVGGITDDIKWIELDDMPVRSKEVDVSLAADTFKTANIRSVEMTCRVVEKESGETEKIQSFIFSYGVDLQQKFNFIKKRGVEYTYDYKATIFLDNGFHELPSSMALDWKSVDGPFIYFNAAEYFEPTELNVSVDDSSIFEHSHLVQIDIDIVNADDIQVTQKTIILDKEKTDLQNFKLIAPKNSNLRRNLKVTYFIQDSADHSEEYKDYGESYFFVSNPFENKWNAEVTAIADWDSTSKLITEFRVFDVTRQEYILAKHHFSAEQEVYTLQVVASLETPKNEFDYRVTAIIDGQINRSPWIKHRGPALIITDSFKSERTIRATLVEAPDFEDKEIRKATIQFKYDDGDTVNIESEKLRFTATGDTVKFTHDMPNHNKQHYSYQIRILGDNGERFKTDWIEELADDLQVTIDENIW